MVVESTTGRWPIRPPLDGRVALPLYTMPTVYDTSVRLAPAADRPAPAHGRALSRRVRLRGGHGQPPITFRRVGHRSNRLASWLVAGGVEQGDRVALYLPAEEALEWIVAYAGVHKAGAVAVPTRPASSPASSSSSSDAGAVAAIAGGVTQTRGARPRLPALQWMASTTGPPAGFVSWSDIGAGRRLVQVPLTGDDLADIMYTSGTTGRPKGVAVHHRNVAMVPNGRPAWTGDGWLHASPLFTFAGIASVYNPMKLGMPGLYLPRFDAAPWLDSRTAPADGVFLVPAMAQLLIADPGFDDAELSSIGLVSLGSSPVAPETFRRLHERLPQARVSNNWGMTEAGPAFCWMPPERSRSAGRLGRQASAADRVPDRRRARSDPAAG